MAKSKNKSEWSLNLGREDYDLTKAGAPFVPVLLDNKVIYKIDKTKYMGHQRNQNKEIIAAIKKATKIEITDEQLKRAITVGILRNEG